MHISFEVKGDIRLISSRRKRVCSKAEAGCASEGLRVKVSKLGLKMSGNSSELHLGGRRVFAPTGLVITIAILNQSSC